jgi:hypothetical protein
MRVWVRDLQVEIITDKHPGRLQTAPERKVDTVVDQSHDRQC